MARDPFVEEYQKGMAAVRKSRPKKRKLSLGKAAEKRDTFRDELSVDKYQQERNPQKQGTGTLSAGYDPLTDRAIRAVGSAFGNPGLERNLRFVDENLIGGAAAENAAFNVGRGEGSGWDALDIGLAAPLAGVVAKPLGVVGRGLRAAAGAVPGAERLAGLAARAGASRPAQYMREVRPLADEVDDAIQTAFTVTPGAQRRITDRRPVVRGLPAPEQRLGLPAPGPGLPEWAAKPRGKRPLDMRREARMERAADMGFDIDTPVYASALRPIDSFDPHGRFAGRMGLSGISVTDNPRMASRYLDRYGSFDYKGAPFVKNIMPLYARFGEKRFFDEPLRTGLTLGAPLPEGYAWPSWLDGVDTAIFPDAISSRGSVRHVGPSHRGALSGSEYILRDPSRLRSIFAAFDPDEIDNPVLMRRCGGRVQTAKGLK